MAKKVFIVTGANRGLGAETAKMLAADGHRVVVATRDLPMGEDVARSIRAATPGAEIDVMELDLASLASVRAFAAAFLAMDLPLQGLVCNAALYAPDAPRSVTKDGFEGHFGTNHLGHFLLVHLLLEKLLASKPSRVVLLSSGLHLGMGGQKPAALDFDDLQVTRGYGGTNAYARSKLANILFAYELDRRYRARGLTVNAASPLLVPATVTRHMRGFQRFLFTYVMPYLPFARTAEEAAGNTVYLATDPAVEGKGGQYVEDKKAIRSSPVSYDEAVAARLWKVSAELVGLPPA